MLSRTIDALLRERDAFSLIFAHAGALHETDGLRKGLLERCQQMHIGSLKVRVDHDLPQDVDTSVDLVVFEGFKRLTRRADRCERLSNLRAWSMVQLESGRSIIALSEVPKHALTGCDGSQLIIDARTFFPSRMTDDEVAAVLTDAGVSPDRLAKDTAWVCGLPRFAEIATRRAADGEWPASRSAAQQEMNDALKGALEELGVQVVCGLEQLLDPTTQRINFSDVSALLKEAFTGSGLLTAVGPTEAFSLDHPTWLPILADEVREVIDASVAADEDVRQVSGGLWEIERTLRRRIQLLAREKHGKAWKTAVLGEPDVAARAMDRAVADRERAYVDAGALENPLEWLTFSELLDVIERYAWACPPETPPAFFRRLRAELSPVRNRAAHFRLPLRGDAEAVARWTALLERKLRL